jgi:hypothetical protein
VGHPSPHQAALAPQRERGRARQVLPHPRHRTWAAARSRASRSRSACRGSSL